jgi:hypothetical protein
MNDVELFTKFPCPTCGELIPISDALQRELVAETDARVRNKLAEHDRDLSLREQAIRIRENAAAEAEAAFELRLEERLSEEAAMLESKIRTAARAEIDLEVRDLRAIVDEQQRAVNQAREMELELRKEKRALQQERDKLALEVSRQVDDERASIIEEAVRRTQEQYRLKDAEKDRKLQDALRVNDELRRKLEQGSQQTQGEVLEAALEELLKSHFPTDVIEPIAKGARGGDLLQHVYARSGHCAGTILWESKNTKSWNEAWIEKLQDDQRSAKADVAVLVSSVLPKDVSGCGLRDGIWVADARVSLGLAMALRNSMVDLALAKRLATGKTEALEVLFAYVTGSEFRHRVEAIVRTFIDMQAELDEEKRVAARRWARREKQITRVVDCTSGMYGDLQGMLGATLPSIAVLQPGVELSSPGNDSMADPATVLIGNSPETS